MAGVKGKSGRKGLGSELELHKLLQKGWPMKKRLASIDKLADRAEKGDLEATKLLLAYAYGKPKEIVRHEDTDGNAIPITVIEVRRPDEG